MTEKILNTRIQLKYDTWDNWQKTDVANKCGNLVLRQGEMAVTAIASGKSDFTTPPTIMFKVGDGEHKFSELPWASGLAADVYAWAKAATKPTYTAAEVGAATTKDISDAIAKIPVVTDTNTQYQLVLTAGTKNGVLKLQSKEKNGTWTDVAGQSFTFEESDTNGNIKIVNGSVAAEIPVHGLDTAAYKADTYFATAESVSKIESSLEGAVEAGIADLDATVSGMAAGKTLQTLTQTDGKIAATFQDISIAQSQVSGLTAALNGKQDNLSFEGTYNASSNKVATKSYVDGKVVGAVQYLGTVANATELAALNPDSFGDFCRVAAAFGSYHAGDLLLCKTLKTDSAAATWDVIHGELDKDTWVANSKIAAGYVAAGGTNANKVWKTDKDGNPAWRDDADNNQTIKAGTTSFGANAQVEIAAGTNVTVTPNAENNRITINSTDSKVTSAANHYAPSAESAAQLSADASSTTAATWNSTSLVTGVNIQRDSKGHVTGVTVDSVKMPANPNTDTNQTVKVGTTTFGENDSIEFAADTGLKVKADLANKSITYSIDGYDADTNPNGVVFVFDCGSATELVDPIK